MHRSAVILIVGFLAAQVSAQPPTVEALSAQVAVTIDGELSEDTWTAGDWYTGFTVLDMPDRAAEVQTRFKVRFDASSVYFGVQADEPDPAGLKADSTQRDQNVWGDDCIEIMLDPTGERIEYYHLMVNSLGTVYDAQMRQGGNVSSVEWDCGIEAAAKVGRDTWSAEFRVPVVELGLTSASTGEWALNVTRARRVGGVELSTFAPLTGGFHQPSLYAPLKLTGADFGKYLWEIRSPYEARVLPDKTGELVYRAKTHITNAGPGFRFIMVRGALGDSAGEWVKDGLDAGQGREYDISVPVALKGRQPLRLEIADRKNPRIALAVKAIQTDIAYSPINIDIKRPWYRDNIYATEDLKAIVFDVTLALPEGDVARALTMSATLSDAGLADAEALATVSAPAQPKATVELPIPELREGGYTLRVTLTDKETKKVLHSATKTINKLPKVAHEWRLDERNVLLHNGEPVLPFGWFSIPAAHMAREGHAYELMQTYSSYWFPVEKVRGNLDDVVQAGTHVTIYPYQSPAMTTPASVWGQPLTDEEAEGLTDRVAALKDHPGIFAWYMADEPELRPALPERLRKILQTVAREDPFHPCIMLNDTIAGVFKYVDGGDILMPDPYPCFIKGGLAAQPIEKTGKFMQACQEAGKGRKAVWITPQGFNYGDYGKKNQRGPNLVELRNQLYQAVVYGAKGFLWYTYSHVSNYPELDLGMRWLSFEVADLKDAILQDPADDVEVSVTAPKAEHVHVSPRRVGKDLYVFVVNTATEPQDVELSISPAVGLRSLYVASEQRSTPLRDGTVIQDTFGVYETHIYTTNAQVGGRESISVPVEQIATANAARKKPGNLAFEDSGAEVTVSSRSTYGCTPNRVLDGILEGMGWRDGTAGKGPDWLTVTWPQTQTVRRAVVYTPSIADLEIQVPEGEGWKTVASVTGNTEQRVEAPLEAPVQTTAIRVLATALMGQEKSAQIWEVEAYGE